MDGNEASLVAVRQKLREIVVRTVYCNFEFSQRCCASKEVIEEGILDSPPFVQWVELPACANLCPRGSDQ